MATPNSKTAIANLALRHLKIDPVSSIDPPDADSKAAKAAADWYDQARRDTLEAHPWKFASRRRNILAEADAPTFEWAKKYQLPSDYIRVNYIGDDWRNPDMEYDLEDGYVLSNRESPLPLVYVYDLNDATKFSPKFVTALSYKLAEFMAFEMTGNSQAVAAMAAQFDDCFTKAASVSGQNRPTRRVERSALKEARQYGPRGRNFRSWGDQ